MLRLRWGLVYFVGDWPHSDITPSVSLDTMYLFCKAIRDDRVTGPGRTQFGLPVLGLVSVSNQGMGLETFPYGGTQLLGCLL